MTKTCCLGIVDPDILSYVYIAGTPEEYTMVQPGRYRHYEGNDYEVIGVAKHSETEEIFVVYRALHGERGLWIRPAGMFLETVVVEGLPRPRFQRLPD